MKQEDDDETGEGGGGCRNGGMLPTLYYSAQEPHQTWVTLFSEKSCVYLGNYHPASITIFFFISIS